MSDKKTCYPAKKNHARKRGAAKVGNEPVPRLSGRLKRLSDQLDRARKLDGDESMFQFRFRLPYSTWEPLQRR